MSGSLIIPICMVFILVVVLMHQETLTFITRWFLPRFSQPKRWHVAATVIILISAHVGEIVLYGTGLYVVGEIWGMGGLSGDGEPNYKTYLYFSFASYTSLGIGDIFPKGALRFLTGVEALLGLLMIGWTASFLYLEMRTFWSADH
jgi:hypothetical protein